MQIREIIQVLNIIHSNLCRTRRVFSLDKSSNRHVNRLKDDSGFLNNVALYAHDQNENKPDY